MLGPEQVAAQILGEEIRLLSQLQQMAGNPKLFGYMCQIVDAARNGNGNGNGRVNTPQKPITLRVSTPKSNGVIRTGLTGAVLEYGRWKGSHVTIGEAVDALTAKGFKFTCKNPKVAVAGVFQRYTDSKFKIVKRGTGSEPNVYKWIEGADNASA